MKFLIDNALSPTIAKGLNDAGYDAVHVRDLNMQHAKDSEIFLFAEKHDRIVVSADTDFGTLLALWNKKKPSFILFRRETGVKPAFLLSLLIKNIPQLVNELTSGSIIVITDNKIRIRALPISE